jgi:hypothetical protein
MTRPLILLTFAAVLLLLGCHSATSSVTARVDESAAAPNAAPTEVKTASTGASGAVPVSNSPTPNDEHKNPPAEAIAKTFSPPFPDRADLFEPPRNSAGVVRRDEEHGETVELKGFVNVNGPQVVLAIDGVILPIPEGGEKYGVQVISIKPPTVVLQRGRSRWTASLD